MKHSNNDEAQLSFPVLIGDIGGTNARFQIVGSADGDIETFAPVRTADFKNVDDAVLRSVLTTTKTRPQSALIAAAGPITSQGLDLTNCHWDIRPNSVLPAIGVEQLLLLNDFEAQALSLPFLTDADIAMLGGSHAVRSDVDSKVVLGPGTGLGVAILVRAGGRWVPVAGEGGHVDLGPRTAGEAEIWKHLTTIGGRISAEQVVCGDGLVNLYIACCASDGATVAMNSPAQISAAAIDQSNAQAEEALSIFCLCLGRIAGDLALTASAKGGVFIAGGIGQKILPFLKTSEFRSAFEDKAPHNNLMQSITTSVVTHPLPALLGLAGFAVNPQAFAIETNGRFWTTGG